MTSPVYKHAHQLIRTLQEELSTLRQSTYKTVHDDIGSIISAASIKAKVLSDKVTDSYEKKQLEEIHGLIRETMEHVTTLNKKLKVSWIPQGSNTLIQDLRNEFAKIAAKFDVAIELRSGEESIKKMNYPSIMIVYEWAQICIHHAIACLAQKMLFAWIPHSTKFEIQFVCDASVELEQNIFDKLGEKLRQANASMITTVIDGKPGFSLSFPTEGEK